MGTANMVAAHAHRVGHIRSPVRLALLVGYAHAVRREHHLVMPIAEITTSQRIHMNTIPSVTAVVLLH